MAMKVRYTVIDGEVLHENRNGVQRDYLPDPQGSTVALLDSTQTITDTFSYWPYGEEKSHVGTGVTPLRYVGRSGYYRDSPTKTYVRAREVDVEKGRWMTEDPIGFRGGLNLFEYVDGNPITMSDPEGLQGPPGLIIPPNMGQGIMRCVDCASDIHRRWSQVGGKKTWFHDCNHMWSHCMACCALKKLSGIGVHYICKIFKTGYPRDIETILLDQVTLVLVELRHVVTD